MTRRLLAALAAGALPWTAIVVGYGGSDLEYVFAWGLITTDPLHAVTLPAYLFEHTAGLPDRLLAWPVAVLLYAMAVGSTAFGTAVGPEDRRFTAGTYTLAGASLLAFALGVARRNPEVTTAVPVGTALLWGLAWWSWWGSRDDAQPTPRPLR